MAAFTQAHPGLEVIEQEDTTGQILKQVLAYEAAIALVSNPVVEERIESREALMEELMLAVPPGHAPHAQAGGAGHGPGGAAREFLGSLEESVNGKKASC